MKTLKVVATLASLALPLGLAGVAEAMPVNRMAQHTMLSHRGMMYHHRYHHHHRMMPMHKPMMMHHHHRMMHKAM